jgi:hypothetical protein
VISLSLYQQLRELGKIGPFEEISVTCRTATSQPLNILGQGHCKLCLDKYTWKVTLLVSDNLACPAILGTDFLAKTGLLMELRTQIMYFPFDPENKLSCCTGHRQVTPMPISHGTHHLEGPDDSLQPDLSNLPLVQNDAICHISSFLKKA